MNAHVSRIAAADDIAAAAARLTGTPDQLAARLRSLIDEGSPRPPKAGTGSAHEAAADHRRAVQQHADEVATLHHRLAADFAEARGWRVTPAPLSTRAVSRRAGAGTKWHLAANEWGGYLANPTFYRTADHRAVAAVGHLGAEVVDDWTSGPGAALLLEEWADARGLTVSFPDFPSWQNPGRARLVVFESDEPVEVAAPAPAPVELGLSTLPAPSTAPDLDAMGAEEPAEAMSQNPAPAEASDQVAKIDTAPAAPSAPVMRPIAPLVIDGMAPRDLADEEDPHFDIVDPRELWVDEQYQRGLSPKSLALIRRIVENWSWSKYKVPNCVRVDGRLHVIDGQHTAIAAASHPGIQAVLVLVSTMPEITDRAAAFVSHATNRLQATAVQLHRASLTAGDPEAAALDAVCRAAGVRLLPFPAGKGTAWSPGETVAVVGIRRLIERRGAERATEILGVLAAAELAPISGDHVRLAETLLCDEAYAGGFDAAGLAAALRGLTAKTHAEARELAIAQRLAPWRALAAVMFRNRTKPTTTRRRAAA